MVILSNKISANKFIIITKYDIHFKIIVLLLNFSLTKSIFISFVLRFIN